MRKLTVILGLLLLTLSFEQKANAQDTPKPAAPPAHYYHLDVVIQELNAESKLVNSRAYSTTVSTDKMDVYPQIRTGSRIPIVTAMHADANASEKSGLQYQYIDVGVNVAVRGSAHEIGSQLAFSLVTEISSLADSHGASSSADPVIRQNRWQATVLIPIGKPTVVFKSDDLDSKGGMQVVATATLLQ